MSPLPAEVASVRKAICGKCRGERKCFVRGHHASIDIDDQLSWKNEWYILECCGCEFVFIQKVRTSPDTEYSYTDDKGEIIEENDEDVFYWPQPPHKEVPEWLNMLIQSGKVDKLRIPLLELYSAVNSGMTVLSTIGIRTCFDIASELLGIDGSIPFFKKLEELSKSKALDEASCRRLSTLIDAGNASAHRGWCPDHHHLGALMSILENFLFEQFAQPEERSNLDRLSQELNSIVPQKTK